ncbi:hypothetical protein GE061_015700 [Apolygus lucorum]|uniref:Uncharacterized protein n=1 Tax=Apolygus lucorum TaxID=248454 RepID=A0A8S9XPJ1_APOLU|nr:hypothetical protein GE061_015700 [Apolygus lucorum]
MVGYMCVAGMLLFGIGVGTALEPERGLGTLFLNPRPLILTAREWRIVVDIDVVEIVDRVRKIGETVATLTQELRPLTDKDSRLKPSYVDVKRAAKVAQDLEEAADEMKDYLPSTRARRGLVNFGGTVLKVLFGTPDADEMEIVRKGIQAGREQGQKLVMVEKEHLVVTRTLSKGVTENAKRLQAMAADMMNLTLVIKSHQNQIRESEALFNRTLWVLQLVREVEVDLLRAGEKIREITSAVGEGALGKLSPLLISPRELSQLVSLVVGSLPRELTMVAGTGVAQMHSHYQSAQVSGWHDEQTIHLMLSFPLETKGPRYTMYEVATTPVLDQASGRHLRVSTQFRYFIVSQDREYYAGLEVFDKETCRQRPMLICSPSFPLVHRSVKDCISSIYYQNSGAATTCEWSVLVQPPAAVWRWEAASQKWYYSLSQPVVLTEQCPDEAAVEITLTGSGVIQPQIQCTLRTATHKLLPAGGKVPEQHFLRNRTIDVPTLWSFNATQQLEDKNLDAIVDRLRQQGQVQPGVWSEDEIRLEAALRMLEENEGNGPALVYGLGGSAVVLLFVLGLGLWWYRRTCVGCWTPQTRKPTLDGADSNRRLEARPIRWPRRTPQREESHDPPQQLVDMTVKEAAIYAAPLKKGGAM